MVKLRAALSAPAAGMPLLLLGGLCLARFAAYVFRLQVVPFFTDFASHYGVSYSEAGLLLSAFLAGYCLVLLPVGAITDRWGPERLLALGCTVFAVGGAAFAASEAWWLLLASRALLGAGAAMVYVPTVKLAATQFGEAHRGRVLGLAEIAGGLGTLTGLSLLPPLAHLIPLRLVAVVMGLLGLVAAVAVLRGVHRGVVLESPVVQAKSRATGATGRTEWVQPLILCGVTGAVLYGWTSFVGWAPTYLQEGLRLPRQTTALVMGLSTVMQLGAAYTAGRVSDHLGRRRPILVGGAATAALGLLALRLLPGLPGAIPAAVLVGIGVPFALNAAMTLSTELLGPGRAGMLVSVTALFGMGSSAIAGTADGWIRDVTGSYSGIWAAGAVLLALAALMSLRLRDTEI